MSSMIARRVKDIQSNKEDRVAERIVDLCFVTSYKMEELVVMPRKRLNLLIERFEHHFCKNEGQK